MENLICVVVSLCHTKSLSEGKCTVSLSDGKYTGDMVFLENKLFYILASLDKLIKIYKPTARST